MRRRVTLGSLALAFALAWGACGGSSSTSPTSVSLNGNYSGPIADTVYGSGTILMTLSQNGSGLTGTYSSQFPAAGVQGGGSMSGTVNNGQSLSASLQPSNPILCPYQLTGTIAGGGASISGTFASFNCTVTETGTFNVSRQ
jgi:hypothetical protein